MDFSDSPQEAAFRAKARAWLLETARPSLPGASKGDQERLDEAKRWQAQKADAGFACISWPLEWGGRGAAPIDQVIFDEEEAKFGRTDTYFVIGLGMCLPTIMTFSDDETKRRFAAPGIHGEEIWCQLFSEPSAGSDLAAVRTRAVQTDDGSSDWIINGQKVWTSGAHYSDFGLLLTRSDPTAPKHKGLTMFWVDMTTPGIESRPIHQASGESEFNEVYFTDVRVPDRQRIGQVDRGWAVALVTLMNERLAVGGAHGSSWRDLLSLAQGLPGPDGAGSAADDGAFRERLAHWYVTAEGLRYTRYRALTALSRGQTPGPESAIGKILSARQMQDIGQEAMAILDQFGMIDDARFEAPDIAGFRSSWFTGAMMRIAGGTDEILKNIIAERVLGLPQDIRVDRDVAFGDIPHGA